MIRYIDTHFEARPVSFRVSVLVPRLGFSVDI